MGIEFPSEMSRNLRLVAFQTVTLISLQTSLLRFFFIHTYDGEPLKD